MEKSQPGERLDKFLCTRFPAVSRGAIQRLIEEGHILVNDRPKVAKLKRAFPQLWKA